MRLIKSHPPNEPDQLPLNYNEPEAPCRCSALVGSALDESLSDSWNVIYQEKDGPGRSDIQIFKISKI